MSEKKPTEKVKDPAEKLSKSGVEARPEDRTEDRAEVRPEVRQNFISVVSHDLVNPLAAIQLSLEMILQTLEREDASDVIKKTIKSQTDRALRSSKKMMDLIQDLLDQSKLETGKIEIQKDRYRIAKLIRDLAAEFLPLAEKKQIRLKFISTFSEYDAADFDFNRLYQALSNLIGNAIKFTAEAGTVSVSTQVDENEVVFEILDNGRGIVKQNQKKVFEAYWQDSDGGRQGVGLGLSIAHGIVISHDGRIELESEQGAGSCFKIVLPRWTFAKPSAIDVLPAITEFSNKPIEFITFSKPFNILLVDDDEDLRAMMKELLVSLNLVVKDVASGADALMVCKNFAFDLLVVDYQIADMTGADLALAIESQFLQTVPLLLVSGDADLREKVLPDNIVARISKPIHLPHFIETVRKILSKS